MANIGFEFESRPTFRDREGRFAASTEQLKEDKRAMMRELGRRWMVLTREEARGGPGGTVAKQVSWGTFVRGDIVGFRSRLGQIAKWHISGTGIYGPRGQLIRPVKKQALHFKSLDIVRMWSRGVRPDNFLRRGHDRWEPEAQAAVRRISTRWAARVSG